VIIYDLYVYCLVHLIPARHHVDVFSSARFNVELTTYSTPRRATTFKRMLLGRGVKILSPGKHPTVTKVNANSRRQHRSQIPPSPIHTRAEPPTPRSPVGPITGSPLSLWRLCRALTLSMSSTTRTSRASSFCTKRRHVTVEGRRRPYTPTRIPQGRHTRPGRRCPNGLSNVRSR
jgi:hypothetical protein